jgi:hypothetical protein
MDSRPFYPPEWSSSNEIARLHNARRHDGCGRVRAEVHPIGVAGHVESTVERRPGTGEYSGASARDTAAGRNGRNATPDTRARCRHAAR